MRLLSFDTSGELHLCLMDNHQVVYAKREGSPDGRQTIASNLMPAIDEGLKKAGWKKDSLDVLVVGIGPGSFTGIRSGIVIARTIGQALNLPVIGINKLECLSVALDKQLPAAIVLKAGTNRGIMHYFAAAYGVKQVVEVEPCYLPAEKLSTALGELNDWYGESDCQDVIEDAGGRFIKLPDIENIAIIQAGIAEDRLSLSGLAELSHGLSKNEREDLAKNWPYTKVTPLYLRGPSITLKASK